MKFKVGDVCITQGSSVPLLNDNQLVVITAIEQYPRIEYGEALTYRIQRVDGRPHPSTWNQVTKTSNWYQERVAVCAERRLRKFEDGDLPSGIVREAAVPVAQEEVETVDEGVAA